MIAVVIVQQILSFFRDPICQLSRLGGGRLRCAIDDVLGACKQTRLVPLRTGACFPVFAAYVAELVTAGTTIIVSQDHQRDHLPSNSRDVVAPEGKSDNASASATSLPAAFLSET